MVECVKCWVFSIFLEIVVKPTSNELIARAYDNDDDKDDDYEDDEEDGQVKVHITAFGDHAHLQHFLLFVQQLAVNHVVITHPHPPTPTHPPAQQQNAQNAPKRRKTEVNTRRLEARLATTTTTTTTTTTILLLPLLLLLLSYSYSSSLSSSSSSAAAAARVTTLNVASLTQACSMLSHWRCI